MDKVDHRVFHPAPSGGILAAWLARTEVYRQMGQSEGALFLESIILKANCDNASETEGVCHWCECGSSPDARIGRMPCFEACENRGIRIRGGRAADGLCVSSFADRA
ncbi:MAG: hypothetical protein J5747_02810 [Spirochaetaceae bacterium]|nr:hypothetical protein [Spirochaetaceae bacterium]